MVIEYMERDPQLTFGQTWWCTFCGFMAAALLMVTLMLGPIGLIIGLFYGLVFALPATPAIAFTWFVIRQLMSEKFYTCIPFGCVAGAAFFNIVTFSNDWLVSLTLGFAVGAFGGLVYWLVARKMERKPVTLVL